MSTPIRLRTRDLEWRKIEGEIVAIDLDESIYLTVNRSGATLWPLLVEGAPTEALARALAEAFHLTPAEAEQDVTVFLEALEQAGLLEDARR